MWDRGTYEHTTARDGKKQTMDAAIRRGHCTFTLHGKKLRGGFALTRMNRGRKPMWLLVKMRDEYADARWNILRENASVLFGKTLTTIRQ